MIVFFVYRPCERNMKPCRVGMMTMMITIDDGFRR